MDSIEQLTAYDAIRQSIDGIGDKIEANAGDPEVPRGLFAIASAIDRLADAICEASGKPALPPNF